MPIKIYIKKDSFNFLLRKNSLLKKEAAIKIGVSEKHFLGVVNKRYPVSVSFTKKVRTIFPTQKWEKLFCCTETAKDL